MRVDHFMQQWNWNRSEVSPDAAVHAEHVLLIRCDIRPRLGERSRDEQIMSYEIHII
jgi:hypothetical protein